MNIGASDEEIDNATKLGTTASEAGMEAREDEVTAFLQKNLASGVVYLQCSGRAIQTPPGFGDTMSILVKDSAVQEVERWMRSQIKECAP